MQRIFALLLSISGILGSCGDSNVAEKKETYRMLEGETMGTYYKVTVNDPDGMVTKESLDSLLVALNMEVSTYIDSSVISRFNQAKDSFLAVKATHFLANLERSALLDSLSHGAFDPTVMPLVNYWGFGYTPKKPVTKVDSSRVRELIGLVGMEKLSWAIQGDSLRMFKAKPGIQLDFSAIAKGYGVDLVGKFIQAKGIDDVLVEIGGEVRAWGLSPRGDAWRLGVNVPEEDAGLTEVYSTVALKNRAMATSGNYRNLYEVDGVKYSHTINPGTGFPERNRLLSATILSADCMTADALATACMVLGPEKAISFLEGLPEVDALLIFSAENGGMQSWSTKGLQNASGK